MLYKLSGDKIHQTLMDIKEKKMILNIRHFEK